MKTSKFVRQIISDLKSNPETWKRKDRNLLQKEDIQLIGFTNDRIFSTVDVFINQKGCYLYLSFWDKFYLESAISKWMKNASVDQLR